MKSLEACAANLESVIAAADGGADRIELCSALGLGGLTPSAGMIAKARDLFLRQLFVLIRAREGNFNYTDAEIESMLTDIFMCKTLGADGVVIGALTPDKQVDMRATTLMAKAAQDMGVTFHRAFDRCADRKKALEDIISAGCSRVLTSGQMPNAAAGAGNLAEIHAQAAGRIRIQAGGGVTVHNAEAILTESHADDLHGSFSYLIGDQKITSADDLRTVRDIMTRLI